MRLARRRLPRASDYCALDTETYRGRAFLLSTPVRVYQLSGWDDFLAACLETERKRFVWWNLDYDVTALFKWLPRELVERLTIQCSGKIGDTYAEYLPGKYLRLSRKGAYSLRFYDLYYFYQSSLDSAAEKYLGERKLELPEGLIANLSPSVYLANKALVDEYAIRDAALTQRLCDRVVENMREAGIMTRDLFSPGHLAKTLLRQRKIVPTATPKDWREAAVAAYYGGRTEILGRGHYSKVRIYDLHSAYPSAIAQLPDFTQARCSWSRFEPPKGTYYLARVRVTTEPGTWQPFPWRGADDSLVYPALSDSALWLTSPEIEAARECGFIRSIEFERVLEVYAPKQSRLRDLVLELYEQRQRDSGASQIAKLILNSLYGVFAERRSNFVPVSFPTAFRQLEREQANALLESFARECETRCKYARRYWLRECGCSICNAVRFSARKLRARFRGQDHGALLEHNGTFYRREDRSGRLSCPIQAAMITGQVRAMLTRAVAHVGTSRVLATFTDSVFVLPGGKAPAPRGKGLGEWELEYNGPVTIVGCGIYAREDQDKARGHRLNSSLSESLANARGPIVATQSLDRLTVGRMIRLPFRDFASLNILADASRGLDVNMDDKRVWPRYWRSGREVLEGRMLSHPLTIHKGRPINA